MDTGAPCRQCGGRGFYGGGRSFSYGEKAYEPCDICEGMGIEGAPRRPSMTLEDEIAEHGALLRYVDDLKAFYRALEAEAEASNDPSQFQDMPQWTRAFPRPAV